MPIGAQAMVAVVWFVETLGIILLIAEITMKSTMVRIPRSALARLRVVASAFHSYRRHMKRQA